MIGSFHGATSEIGRHFEPRGGDTVSRNPEETGGWNFSNCNGRKKNGHLRWVTIVTIVNYVPLCVIERRTVWPYPVLLRAPPVGLPETLAVSGFVDIHGFHPRRPLGLGS